MSRPPIPKSLISKPNSRLIGLEYPGGSAEEYFRQKNMAAKMASVHAASAFDPSMAGRGAIAKAKAEAARLRSPPSLSTVHDELFYEEAPAAAAAAPAAPLKSVVEIKIKNLFDLINGEDKKKYDSYKCERILLDIKTNPNAKEILNSRDVNGYTPLCLACDKDYDYIALQLIKIKEVDIYLPDSVHKDTPLIYASRHGLVGVVESLLLRNEIQAKGDLSLAKRYINYQGMGGQTALHNACNPAIYEVNKTKDPKRYNSDKQKIFDLLIKNGANLEITDHHGNLASVLCAPRMAKRGGYRATRRDKKYLKRYKQGKSIGFTMRSSLKAKGLIPRANGTRRVSRKYK